MSFLLSTIVFVLIFSLLILIHELGHFWMAKRSGIKVEEFGIGLPPRIWGKKKGETIYSINWIPFGGFIRMFGEMGDEKRMLKSKRSFVGKSARDRIKVVVAGVVMNFFLAWILLTAGFVVGMQPLLGPEDVLPAIENGQVLLEPGLVVENVADGSMADLAGFHVGDRIHSFNQHILTAVDVPVISERYVGTYEVERSDEVLNLKIKSGEEFGLKFYEYTDFPSVQVFNVQQYSQAYKAGFRKGDVILSVNGQSVYDAKHFDAVTRFKTHLSYLVYRDGRVHRLEVQNPESGGVVISKVLPDTPAASAKLMAGDLVLFVEGVQINRANDLIKFVGEHGDDSLKYLINRDGGRLFFNIKAQEGRIGVLLSELLGANDQGLTVYDSNTLSSVVEIKEERYPWYQAPVKAFTEGYRMSVMTGKMFVSMVGSLVKGNGVPSSVAGPVGIAKMTHSFVQDGSVIPLLRFIALLSLSLAVINILPIPALDGGRLLFIIIELIVGRRLNQRWESYVHALGYILILALILFVTFNDIVG